MGTLKLWARVRRVVLKDTGYRKIKTTYEMKDEDTRPCSSTTARTHKTQRSISSTSVDYLALSPRLKRSGNYETDVRKTASVNEIHQLYTALQDLVAPSPIVTGKNRAHIAPIALVNSLRNGRNDSGKVRTPSVQRSKSDITGTGKSYRVREVHETKSPVSETKSDLAGKKKHRIAVLTQSNQKKPCDEQCKEKQRELVGAAVRKSDLFRNEMVDIDTLIKAAKLNAGPVEHKGKKNAKIIPRGCPPAKKPLVISYSEPVNTNFSVTVVSSRLKQWYHKATEQTIALEGTNDEGDRTACSSRSGHKSQSDSKVSEPFVSTAIPQQRVIGEMTQGKTRCRRKVVRFESFV